MFKKLCSKKGFSLAELLIVIAIIAILAGIVIMNMTGSERGAKAAKLRANLVTFREAILAYKADHGHYPCAPGDYNTSGDTTIFKRQLLWFTNKDGRPSHTKSATYGYGPYLQAFPLEPFTNSTRVVIDQSHERVLERLKADVYRWSGATGGWYYEAKSGNVVANLGRSLNLPREYTYY